MLHPWFDVPIGASAPITIQAIIEVPSVRKAE